VPIVAVLVTVAVLLVAGAARASNSDVYRDPVGDTVAAPDIGEVRVTNDDAGRLVFTVGIDGRRGLEAADAYVLWIDADLNERNGASGYEYAVVVDGGSRKVVLARFDGGKWAAVPSATLSARWRRGLVVTLDRTAIGSPAQLDFGLTSAAGGDVDSAPDRRPDWRYQPIVSPSA
jgi:hypothetical protein